MNHCRSPPPIIKISEWGPWGIDARLAADQVKGLGVDVLKLKCFRVSSVYVLVSDSYSYGTFVRVYSILTHFLNIFCSKA